MTRVLKSSILFAAVAVLAGCATTPPEQDPVDEVVARTRALVA